METTEIIKPKKLISPNLNTRDSYTVEFGDPVYSISKKRNVSLTTLKKLNKLDTNEISIGQELILSKSPIKKAIKYKVEVGDTIYSIAKNNQTSVSNLIKINNLKSNNIAIGQLLIIK
jgi:N-acetylmuramoyl-L-alanine amidase